MKYLFVLTAFLTTIGYSSCVTCSDEAKEYSKVEFDMKIEKIPNYRKSRNIILEGKDKNGNNIRWQDFNIWLNNDPRNVAQVDAEIFFKNSKLPTSIDRYYYEEWIIALTRIAKLHGLKVLDNFFLLYHNKYKTGTKPDINLF